jgi:hypothetical protein
MNIDKTGGPAFPSVLFTQDKAPNHHDAGMTLRDYFAGQALAHCLDRSKPVFADEKIATASCEQKTAAAWAYQVADAMIAARNEGAKP